MTFPVVWLMPDVKRKHVDSRYRLTWDGWLPERLLTELGGVHGVDFESLPAGQGAVMVIPAGYYADRIDWLNDKLAALPWAVALLTSDEESTFDADKLVHPNLNVWVQAPRPGKHDGDRFLPIGFPPGTTETLTSLGPQDRCYDWSFAGQVNHPRRHQLMDVLAPLNREKALLAPTQRFATGMGQQDYLRTLAQSKVVPCPSGPRTPDTFRMWEALEAGAIPVVDARCPAYGPGFWDLLGIDVPVVDEWPEFPALLERLTAGWPANANRVQASYRGWLRDLKLRLARDIEARST